MLMVCSSNIHAATLTRCDEEAYSTEDTMLLVMGESIKQR